MSDKRKTALDGYETAQAQKVGKLHAQAGGFTAMGQHDDAGDAHYERGMVHEKAGDHSAAKDAFKAAADSFKKHIGGLEDHVKSLDDAAGCSLTPEQVRAWHARENASDDDDDDDDDDEGKDKE